MARKSFVEQLTDLAVKNQERQDRRWKRIREGAEVLDEDDDLDEDDMGTAAPEGDPAPMDDQDDDWKDCLMAAMKVCPPDIAKKIHALLKPQEDDADDSFAAKMESLSRRYERRQYGIQLIQEARRRTGQNLRVPPKEVGKRSRRPFAGRS